MRFKNRNIITPRKFGFPKNIYEGKGTVYTLISDSQKNLELALSMAKKNKKLRNLIPGLKGAIDSIAKIE